MGTINHCAAGLSAKEQVITVLSTCISLNSHCRHVLYMYIHVLSFPQKRNMSTSSIQYVHVHVLNSMQLASPLLLIWSVAPLLHE